LGEAEGQANGIVAPTSLRWNTLRGPAAFATPHREGWQLALRPETLTAKATPAFLGVRQQHKNVDVWTQLDPVTLLAGEEAGLVIRQNERDHVRLYVESDRIVVAHRRADLDAEVASMTLSPGAVVTLRISARGQDYALLAATGIDEPQQLCIIDGRTLDTTVTGGFTGLWFGIYATSNGQPTKTTITFAPFEYIPR